MVMDYGEYSIRAQADDLEPLTKTECWWPKSLAA